MSARNGGLVAVGFVGFTLALVGVLFSGLGISWLYAMQKYNQMIAEALEGTPEIPAAVPIFIWISAVSVFLIILGISLISMRHRIVEHWLLGVGATSDGAVPERSLGSVVAVGIAGLCIAVFGLSEITGAAVAAIVSGWDDDWTYVLWSGLPLIIIGLALVLRPRILARWWKSQAS